MKEVKGIKALCITAIVLNGGFGTFVFFMIMFIAPNRPRGGELAPFLAVMLGILICTLYPAQLLIIRKKYYSHRPVSASARVLVHILRVIQILFTCFITVVLTFGIIEMVESLRRYNSLAYQQSLLGPGSLLFVMLVGITINAIVFFKGWRLLKIVRHSNYLEEVMASFD
jgi:hypothetical protein